MVLQCPDDFLNWNIQFELYDVWCFELSTHILQNYQLPAYSVFIRDCLYTHHVKATVPYEHG